MLQYALYPNHLTDDPNDQMGIPQNVRSRTIEDIIDRMISRGSTVTKAEAFGVFEEFESAVAAILGDGEAVNTPLFKISPSISGVFADENDSFDRSRHVVNLNLTPGGRISDIARSVKVQKVTTTAPEPVLQSFRDIGSGTVNDILTPGGVGEINGSLLKIDPSDLQQGIFFVAQDGTESRAAAIIRNKPANLIFTIPDLAPGSYQVEVRLILHNHKSAKSGRLSTPLTVPGAPETDPLNA